MPLLHCSFSWCWRSGSPCSCCSRCSCLSCRACSSRCERPSRSTIARVLSRLRAAPGGLWPGLGGSGRLGAATGPVAEIEHSIGFANAGVARLGSGKARGELLVCRHMESAKKYELCTPMLLLFRRIVFSPECLLASRKCLVSLWKNCSQHENAYFPYGKREEV